MTSILVQLSPASAMHELVHLLLTQQPELELGMVSADGAVGQAELHANSVASMDLVEQQVLAYCGLKKAPENTVSVTNVGLLEGLADAHASLINRARNGALVVVGDSFLQLAVEPAVAALDLVEQLVSAQSKVKLVDIRLAGAAGRLYLAGDKQELDQLATLAVQYASKPS